MHGFESVVGPVKGVFDKETSLNKAREHSLLRSDRPAYVTILSLGAPPPPPPSKGWRASVAPGSFAVGTWRTGSCPESHMESLFSSCILCSSLHSFRNCSVSLGARICFLQTRIFLKVRFFTFFVP